MSYYIPNWGEGELNPLWNACFEALTWAERYDDGIMMHELQTLINLIEARHKKKEAVIQFENYTHP